MPPLELEGPAGLEGEVLEALRPHQQGSRGSPPPRELSVDSSTGERTQPGPDGRVALLIAIRSLLKAGARKRRPAKHTFRAAGAASATLLRFPQGVNDSPGAETQTSVPPCGSTGLPGGR